MVNGGAGTRVGNWGAGARVGDGDSGGQSGVAVGARCQSGGRGPEWGTVARVG